MCRLYIVVLTTRCPILRNYIGATGEVGAEARFGSQGAAQMWEVRRGRTARRGSRGVPEVTRGLDSPDEPLFG
jgi:hypothetical protein